MSTTRTNDSVNEKQGYFRPGIAPKGPVTDKGHKPGVKASSNDRAPEFHAQTLPPGTAPASSSYQPNPIHETPSQANNPDALRAHGKENTFTRPNDTFPGATSRDVHTGLGKPLNRESNIEVYHSGSHGRKRQTFGIEGVGTSARPKHTEHSIGDPQKVSDRRTVDQRGIEREDAQPRQHSDQGALVAEDLRPETAGTVAREHGDLD